MNTEQLMTLCQRHHALLLASDTEMISIAVVGNPASELMEALRFATQKRIDITRRKSALSPWAARRTWWIPNAS